MARLHFKMAAGLGTIHAGFAGKQNTRVLGVRDACPMVPEEACESCVQYGGQIP